MPAKPLILAALGARGTGKSAWTKQTIKKAHPSRLAVWDLMKEYDDLEPFDRLGDAIRAMKAKRFAIAFRPSRDAKVRAQQFEVWCRALLAARRVFCVVEELAFVTKPTKAPPGWQEMVLLGRHPEHELSIMGTSQRPASIDKDFLSNCDLVHSGRLAYKPDALKAAEVLGVSFEDLLRLPDLHYVERRAGDTEAKKGVLVFPGGRAPSGKRPQDEKVTDE